MPAPIIMKETTMKFTFYWLDGTKEILEGNDAAEALNRAGYGAGALGALDFYARGEDNNYDWDANKRSWKRVVFREGF